MALPNFAPERHAEYVISYDEKLFDYIDSTSWFRDEAIPQGIFSVWPSRAKPGPQGWERDPVRLCQPKARPLLQRLRRISTVYDPKLTKNLRHALGGALGEANLIDQRWQSEMMFVYAYKSVMLEILALCIALEDEERAIPESKISLRFKLYADLLGHLAKINDGNRRTISIKKYSNSLLATISKVFNLSTWFHAHTLVQYWLLKTELRLGPRISTWLLQVTKPKVSEQAVAYSLSHFSKEVTDSCRCIKYSTCFQAIAEHPSALATDTHAAYNSNSILEAVADSSSRCLRRLKCATTYHDEGRCPRSNCQILQFNQDHQQEYRSPKAIALNLTSEGQLDLVPVSRDCMAVSHVLDTEKVSFGLGVSTCMHALFCDLARKFQCESYYVGPSSGYLGSPKPTTPSIGDGEPEEDAPEEQMIADNLVFEKAKCALVYDPQIVQFEHPESSRYLLKTLAFALLTSAWSRSPITRMHTASSAGCMHILCKDGETLALGQLARLILEKASLEIAIALRTNEAITKYAVLPPETQSLVQAPTRYEVPDFEQMLSILSTTRFKTAPEWIGWLWMQLHQSLLATSLLTEHDVKNRKWDLSQWSELPDIAESFWRIQCDMRSTPDFTTLPARWLISATPRLNKFGLSWAPVSPQHCQLKKKSLDDGWRFYHSGPIVKGSRLEVTHGGLKGSWRTFIYPSNIPNNLRSREEDQKTVKDSYFIRLDEILRTYGWGFSKIALIQAMGNTDDIDGVDVYGSRNFVVSPQGRADQLLEEETKDYMVCGVKKGRMVAVLATNNNGTSWCWRGVFIWEMNVPLPEFGVMHLTIV